MARAPRHLAAPGLALSVALGLFVTAHTAPAHAQTHDPRLDFRTYETAHFRVHFYRGLEEIAHRIASIGEGVYGTVGDLMGWHPRQKVEVVVTDQTDDGNAFALVVPYNTIRFWVTSPEDLSVVGEYDDYFQSTLIHEFTHIAHMDNISGAPAIINAIFGKIYPPNNVQPPWVLEGIAVYSETRNSSGGRLRSSLWDMWMRADALEERFVTVDQMQTADGPLRWPHGNIRYLYGSHFIQYIVQRFGEGVLAEMSRYYGGQLVPFAINRQVQRATGFTIEELYPEFLQSLRDRYAAQRREIEARGLRQGEQITFQGENEVYPRFLPDGHTVAYESDDQVSHVQIRTVDVAAPTPQPRGDRSAWIDALSGFALDPDGRRLYVSDTGFYRGVYFYRDLYERTADIHPDGRLRTPEIHAMTDGARAMYPDVSPDGDHLAFVVNHHGTTTLFEMSLTDRHPVQKLRVRNYEQVYTPRYSPDGRKIAFSHWRRGGYRDVRILDRETGEVTDLTHDRALDTHPVWSPDGRYLYYCSDRTGVSNVYAHELATGVERQVTNVLTGAFMPAVSPDGRTLVYVGYTSRGYDLFRMPLEPERWLEPGPTAPRTGETIPTPDVPVREHAYRPIDTLIPRYWAANVGDDGFGPRLDFYTSGQDVVGNHSYSLQTSIGLTRGDVGFDASYVYQGMRPTMHTHVYRTVNAAVFRSGAGPGAPGGSPGVEYKFPFERWGGEAGLTVGFPSLFFSQTLGLQYEAQYAAPLERVPFGLYADPNEPAPSAPSARWYAGLRAFWSFSHVFGYGYSLTAQEGYAGSLSIHATDRALGSSSGSFDVSGAAAAYVPMPWSQGYRRQVLAVRLAGGLGITDVPSNPIYFLGGFPSFGVADFVTSIATLSQYGGVALRGYPQFSRYGNAFYLLNVEYRFPIVQIDRGPATLPIYLRRVYGNLFVDVGNAFYGAPRIEDAAVGVGAEVLIDFVVGYYLAYTLRVGLADGLRGDDGGLQGYALLSAPF